MSVNRRDLLGSGALLAGAAALPLPSEAAKQPKRVLMKLGATVRGGFPGGGRGGPAPGAPAGAPNAASPEGSRGPRRAGGPPRDPEFGFRSLGRWGIKNVVATAQIADGRLYATVDELNKLTDTAAKFDISVDVLNPPFLASTHIDRERNPAIMLGESPQRDRDIEQVQTMIKNCAAAKIPCIKYNMSLLGVLRTGHIKGRGDSEHGSYKLKEAKAEPPLTRAGVVDADRYWERITYFLDRVIPVANEYKVRMACHPNDSPVPPEGYQGIVAVLGTVEGLKKFITIKESPYHGLNFCQGTISEMLQDPGKEIYDIIRYFGTRKKIFNVHFRNIKGRRDDFSEVAPDEGDVDMFKAIQTYKEVDFPYMVQPDHDVFSPSDSGGEYTAFVCGYIRALMQAADRTA